ncbi:hypothetical protein CEY00_Acc15528 [Actinidia chinensis var. chinensis]|uniref:Uncharacterized protein n=1 Tax=Actinidia chinensis var. chinensis TaxID=1590841 RepID=A0A2R6QMU5_ACTCC|nr:hypothetical protein CEY00_Acc15528 [Actinidia chinensis var. chinensis]
MCLGFQESANERLKIKAFYLRLSVSSTRKPLPDSLTLYYLPRINGSPLEINGSNIRPDSTAFVTLHRVVSGERTSGDVVFGSRERVRASEGVRFEVYLRDEKLLRGGFRRDERDEWSVECRCVLEREVVGMEVKEAEVCVAAEGREAMREKVEVTVRRRRGKYCFKGLEEIPEEREGDVEPDGCCCCCFEEERELGSDGENCVEEMEFEMEGLRWAVDVGIWVMCLGVGYLVSKASSKSSRHRRLL